MRTGFFIALLLVGCADNAASVERAFDVGPITGLEVSGPASVQVLVGPTMTPQLRVEGDAASVAALDRSTRGRTLVLDASRSEGAQPLRVTVTTPALTSLDARDGATVTSTALRGGRVTAAASAGARLVVTGVDADTTMVFSTGTATVDVSGTTRVVQVSASDVGTASLGGLQAAVARAEATELSVVQVFAREALRGAVSRSSQLVLRGAPQRRAVTVDETSTLTVEPDLRPAAPRPIARQ
jgi:hypothetical protein